MTIQRKQILKRGNKLNARRGETFVELLVAVLVVAFASLIVAVMYSTAFQANLDAQESDKTYYGALTEMESMKKKNEKSLEVTITDGTGSTTVEVDEYGNGTYSSYRMGTNSEGTNSEGTNSGDTNTGEDNP